MQWWQCSETSAIGGTFPRVVAESPDMVAESQDMVAESPDIMASGSPDMVALADSPDSVAASWDANEYPSDDWACRDCHYTAFLWQDSDGWCCPQCHSRKFVPQ